MANDDVANDEPEQQTPEPETSADHDGTGSPEPTQPVPSLEAVTATAAGSKPKPQAPHKFAFLRSLKALTRLQRIIIIVSAAALVIISGGIAVVASQRGVVAQPRSKFAAVVVPFRVVSTQPATNQADVVDASKIVVTFSRAVDPTKLNGDFFTSPTTTGTFAQGTNDHQAVYTPNQPFTDGTAVQVMIHGEFQSLDGAQLGADYTFGFTTKTPDGGVLFQRGNTYDTVGSVKAGTVQTYTLYTGQDVSSGNTVTIYQSTISQLLTALTYNSSNVMTGTDAAGLTAVLTKSNLSSQSTFSFTPAKGVYLLVATNGGKQVGTTWLVASNFGVLMRQDDQQAVFSVQDLTNDSATSADLTLYNLAGNVQKIAHTTIDGVGAVQLPLQPSLDLVVATHGDDSAVLPVMVPQTLADVRVNKNLSTSDVIYGLTDRPTYAPGDTIHYAGFIRTDNDADYRVPAASDVHLYVSDTASGTHYADADVPVTPSGLLNATFSVAPGAIPSGSTSNRLFVYNGSADNETNAGSPIGAFTLTSNKSTAYRLQVHFARTNYIASDTIAASVIGLKPDNSPLVNQKVSVMIYSHPYYENDPGSNAAAFGALGDAISSTPQTITLDADGRATVPVDVSKFPAGSSRVATIQVSFTDPSGVAVGGGASTIVHEGNGTLTFAPSRTVIHSGGALTGRLYARTLSGQPLAHATVTYSLGTPDGDNTKIVATGTVTTDMTGYAEIAQQLGSYTAGTTLELSAATADASNNEITASNYYYVEDPSSPAVFSDVQLSNLDISGVPGTIAVGQTLNLTVNAPAALHVLLTTERGRVHSYRSLDLASGNNSLTLPVTADLAPSFSLVFSYFHDGAYDTEGTTFVVSPTAKQASLTLKAPATTPLGQMTDISGSLVDGNGQPLGAPVIFGVVSTNVFDLNNQVVPDIFGYFYNPLEITTNASSSLTGIGSGGGGKCGGGGGGLPALLNPLGGTASWQTGLATDSSGSFSTRLTLTRGTWRVYAYSMSADGEVASTYTDVTAQ